jgi:ribosomal protein S18 acetylase RimI-like enzyme
MTATSPSTVRELQRSELRDAARLVGRGMCDNPANLRAFGIRDAERRYRALTRFFIPVLHGLYQRGSILGAFRDGTLVGVCGIAQPGLCQPAPLEKLRVFPSLVFSNPIRTPLRVLTWVREWARRDPPKPHWHLGPVAVDSHLQGQGIGGAMLAASCARMDDCGMLLYLETDKSENVPFYQKFGFTVVAEADVLGVPNWFMSRAARIETKGPLSQTTGS